MRSLREKKLSHSLPGVHRFRECRRRGIHSHGVIPCEEAQRPDSHHEQHRRDPQNHRRRLLF